MCFLVSVPSTQTSLDQNLSIKKEGPHISMLQPTPHVTSNNTSLQNLMSDVKNPMNIMSASLASNLALGNINMANLNLSLSQGLAPHLAMHNQLENMINTSTSMTNISNSHHATLSQQHSNGFSSIKRENSPPNILNNNGIPGINMPLNIGAMASIFDPLVSMPMQIPQLSIKKEEKSLTMSQPSMLQKTIDGRRSS